MWAPGAGRARSITAWRGSHPRLMPRDCTSPGQAACACSPCFLHARQALRCGRCRVLAPASIRRLAVHPCRRRHGARGQAHLPRVPRPLWGTHLGCRLRKHRVRPAPCTARCRACAAPAGRVQGQGRRRSRALACLHAHPSAHVLCVRPRSKLTNLRRLEVCGGGVTDVGVASLAALSKLQHLSLAQVGRVWNGVSRLLGLLASLQAGRQAMRGHVSTLRSGMPSNRACSAQTVAWSMDQPRHPTPIQPKHPDPTQTPPPQNFRVGNPAIQHIIKLNELTALSLSQVWLANKWRSCLSRHRQPHLHPTSLHSPSEAL